MCYGEVCMNERTDWVDYAKGIGIILVVYGHVARGVYNAGIYIPEAFYKLADSTIYSFHMPLFFFLSGLFFCNSLQKRGAFKFTLNKLDTIIYPYVLWSILQGSLEVFMGNYTNNDLTLSDVFSLWDPRAQFWFLYALFFVFLTCTLIFTVLKERFSLIVFLFACTLYLSSSLFTYFAPFSFVANNLVFFMLGVMFTQIELNRRLSSGYLFVIALASFVVAQYIFHGIFEKDYSDRGIASFVLACVSIFFIVMLSKVLAVRSVSIIAYIGASSMAIYLMHIVAGSGVRVILSKFMSIDDMFMHIMAGSFFGIMFPILAVQIVQRLNIPYVFSAPVSKCIRS